MEKPDPIQIDPKTFLRTDCSLPALSSIVLKIQEIIQSDDPDIEDVVAQIKKDPGIVAQILKIVNSAYFGLKRINQNPQHILDFAAHKKTNQ